MPEGYPDYQRVNNFDGPSLYELVNGLVEGNLSSGRQAVSRYLSIGGKLQVTVGAEDIIVTFTWWTAQVGGSILSQREMVLSKEITQGCLFNFRNQGPWLDITFTATKSKGTFRIFASNRLSASEFLPTNPAPIRVSPKTVKGTPQVAYPNTYLSGPAEFRAESNATEGAVQIEAEVETNVWVTFWTQVMGSSVKVQGKVILPSTAIRVTLFNLGAAETEYRFTLIPSPTGSS